MFGSAKTKYENHAKADVPIADYIPLSVHLDKFIVSSRNGDLMMTWRLGGIPFYSIDAVDLQIRCDELNNLYRALGMEYGEQLSFWLHNVRRSVTDRLYSEFPNSFCDGLDQKYYDSFQGYRMMANELYLTAIYRPAVSGTERQQRTKRTVKEIVEQQREAVALIEEIGRNIESALSRYDIFRLGIYTNQKNGLLYSSQLAFYAYLINGVYEPIPLKKSALYDYLPIGRLFFGVEGVEFRHPTEQIYAGMLDIKEYPEWTEPGIQNIMLYSDYEYVHTQSFSFYSKHAAKAYLQRQQRQLMNSGDAAHSQIQELTHAMDDLISGKFSIGQYHASLLIKGKSVKQVLDNVAHARALLQNQGFLTASIDLALEAGFYAQIPTNWRYRPRLASLTSRNFAGLASMHGFSAGKRDKNPWGEAVTLLKTPSGQPLYFNFHDTALDEDAFDQKRLGNTMVIGQSGAGKTVLLGFLLAQSQKFKPITVFFDKDRGAELLIRCVGGKYLRLENGKRTGFNPFQGLSTAESDLQWLEMFVRFLLIAGSTKQLTAKEENDISQAVRAVMNLPIEIRRLTTVRQHLVDASEDSLNRRLSKWCQGGPLAWVFDNPKDELDFTTHTTYGFDGTEFLDNPEIRTPLSMYLLQRMENVIDGRRFMYFMDEFWKWLGDDAFRDFAYNKQKTIRKQNGMGVFATQSPAEILKSDISAGLIEQTATFIYLPNPKADYDDYVRGFKISQREYDIVRELDANSRQFLVKQGHRSSIAKLDLSGGFGDELAILSGSTDNIELLDSIMEEVGEDPIKWVPIFHERRKLRK